MGQIHHAGRVVAAFATLSGAILLAGCGPADEPAEMPPLPVKVVQAEARDLPVYREFVGELVSARHVTVRARTGGILLAQHKPDGATVSEGDLLFTIEAREAEERREAARADLAAARAQMARAEADVARYEPLLADEAIARQVYDNAVAAAEAARAAVDARAAALRQAELALDYAEVRSPLDGRMGAAMVSEGALIAAGSTALVEVAVDDPLWVYISPSEADLLSFTQRRRERPEDTERLLEVATLLLGDGREFAHPGRINFADRALDPATNTYRIRAEFPNPEGELLPGQFVRIRLQTDLYRDVVVIPARAVLQVLDQAFVGIVTDAGTVEQRPVDLGPRIDGDWVVDAGIEAGETYIVDGVQKVRPGAAVQPIPAAD